MQEIAGPLSSSDTYSAPAQGYNWATHGDDIPESDKCPHGKYMGLSCEDEPCAYERYKSQRARAKTNEEIAEDGLVVEKMYLDMVSREAAKKRFNEEKLARLASAEGQAELAATFAMKTATADDLDEDDRKEILIDGFLDQDSFARIFGGPKTYKSFVMLDMAGCVGTGTDWHGFQVTQTNVLYVVAEGAQGIWPRVRAWEAHYGKKMANVTFHKGAVQIADENQLRALIAFARAGDYKFVIFDTQARCTVGVNESDNSEMGTIVAALDVVRTETGACVMLVHHSGVGDTDRARGASSMLGAVDSDFECKRTGDGVKIVTKAQKDREYADDLELDVEKKNASLILKSPDQVTEEAEQINLPKITEKQTEALEKMAEVSSISSVVLAQELGLTYNQRNTAAKYAKALMEVGYAKQAGGSRMPYEITDLGHRKLRANARAVQEAAEQLARDIAEAEREARRPYQQGIDD